MILTHFINRFCEENLNTTYLLRITTPLKDHFLGQSWGSLFSQKFENLKCVGDSYFHTKSQKNWRFAPIFFLGILIFTRNRFFLFSVNLFSHKIAKSHENLVVCAKFRQISVSVYLFSHKTPKNFACGGLSPKFVWGVVIFAWRAYFHTKIQNLKMGEG